MLSSALLGEVLSQAWPGCGSGLDGLLGLNLSHALFTLLLWYCCSGAMAPQALMLMELIGGNPVSLTPHCLVFPKHMHLSNAAFLMRQSETQVLPHVIQHCWKFLHYLIPIAFFFFSIFLFIIMHALSLFWLNNCFVVFCTI